MKKSVYLKKAIAALQARLKNAETNGNTPATIVMDLEDELCGATDMLEFLPPEELDDDIPEEQIVRALIGWH